VHKTSLQQTAISLTLDILGPLRGGWKNFVVFSAAAPPQQGIRPGYLHHYCGLRHNLGTNNEHDSATPNEDANNGLSE
jgi:hypothetical protein